MLQLWGLGFLIGNKIILELGRTDLSDENHKKHIATSSA